MSSEKCSKCGRPVWDGGHGKNENECDEPSGEVCTLHARLSILEQMNTAVSAALIAAYRRDYDEAKSVWDAKETALRTELARLHAELDKANSDRDHWGKMTGEWGARCNAALTALDKRLDVTQVARVVTLYNQRMEEYRKEVVRYSGDTMQPAEPTIDDVITTVKQHM